jgi:hypothetical protein
VRIDDAAQIFVDARIEIAIRERTHPRRQVGAEITGLPELFAAVARGMVERQIIAPRPHRLRLRECECDIVDGHTLPERAQQARQIIAEQQRVQ